MDVSLKTRLGQRSIGLSKTLNISADDEWRWWLTKSLFIIIKPSVKYAIHVLKKKMILRQPRRSPHNECKICCETILAYHHRIRQLNYPCQINKDFQTKKSSPHSIMYVGYFAKSSLILIIAHAMKIKKNLTECTVLTIDDNMTTNLNKNSYFSV